jgi:perosamine synthetase
MIPLCKPIFNEEMKDAAIYALENDRFLLGENVLKFEEEFAKYCRVNYAISVNSGTSALHLSLLAIGVNEKDKVLTSPNSFIATANSIFYTNATPVFSDIESGTGNIDPNLLKLKNVNGIIPVHIYGQPCDIGLIKKLTEENNLFLIEDACQAHGAEYKGKKVGSFGDFGCFSFYSTKNMTVCGDGGMITTNDEKMTEKLKSLRNVGRISQYEHDKIGYSYRLNTVNAAIGRVQLKHLDEWNEKRRKNAKLYRKLLPKDVLLTEKKYAKPVYHLFVIRVKNRDKLIEHLKSNGIETSIHYPMPIHLQPIYRKNFGFKEGMFPVAEEFSKSITSLPMYPDLKNEEIKFICEKTLEILQQ